MIRLFTLCALSLVFISCNLKTHASLTQTSPATASVETFSRIKSGTIVVKGPDSSVSTTGLSNDSLVQFFYLRFKNTLEKRFRTARVVKQNEEALVHGSTDSVQMFRLEITNITIDYQQLPSLRTSPVTGVLYSTTTDRSKVVIDISFFDLHAQKQLFSLQLRQPKDEKPSDAAADVLESAADKVVQYIALDGAR